jgi:hypothetical protein
MIDGLENFEKSKNIFIYDSENESYTDITKKSNEVLISGENNDRFRYVSNKKKKKTKDKDIKEDEESSY